jgi:hypothetical protein
VNPSQNRALARVHGEGLAELSNDILKPPGFETIRRANRIAMHGINDPGDMMVRESLDEFRKLARDLRAT